jgi:hypothetical protein
VRVQPEVVDDRVVRMAAAPMWCQLTAFTVGDTTLDDREVLAMVLSHPRYRDHCAGPFASQGHHDLHGPYRIETITVDGFRPVSAAEVLDTLHRWPRDTIYPQHVDSIRECIEIIDAWVSPIVARAHALYQLVVPREGNEHDWGWVVGQTGFFEYIVIGPDRALVWLIIATDD